MDSIIPALLSLTALAFSGLIEVISLGLAPFGTNEQALDVHHTGRLLTGELKEILIEKVQAFLEGFRDARERAADRLHLYVRDGKLASMMWESWPESTY